MSGKSRRGFTFPELLIAMVFISLTLLGYLWMNQASSRGAMDTYFEFLAFSLAQEPIEIFRGMGYDWLEECASGRIGSLPGYPLHEEHLIQDGTFSTVQHPAESSSLKRFIAVSRVESDGVKGFRVAVTISPTGQSRIMAWLSRSSVHLEGLVLEQPR